MTPEELIESGHQGTVSVRNLLVHGSMSYGVPVQEAIKNYKTNIYFNETAPDHLLLLQGDLMITDKHYTLFYSQAKLPMRQALSLDGRHAFGLEALQLLKENLDPSSYEDIMELLDRYEDHIIEFSTFSRDLGDCKGRNTVIWEVRSY
jgi:hypothetical protein